MDIFQPNNVGDSFYLGYFATQAALVAAYPTSSAGYFATVGFTNTIWVWDIGTNAWVNSGVVPSTNDLIPSNEVYINVNDAEVLGKQYQTFAHANAYIQTQTPSAGNKWVINFSGIITEDVIAYDYVSYVGEDPETSIIQGTVTCYNAFANFKDCQIQSIDVDGTQVWTMDNVILLGASITNSGATGYLRNCKIYAGNFGGFNNKFEVSDTLFKTTVGVITLPYNVVRAFHCDFDCDSTNPFHLWGGLFVNSTINNFDFAVLNTGDYVIGASLVSSNGNPIDIPDTVTINFANSETDGSFKVETGGELTIGGSVIAGGVVDAGGYISNLGDWYSNAKSGLSSKDVQGAIDELAMLSVTEVWHDTETWAYFKKRTQLESRTYLTQVVVEGVDRTIEVGVHKNFEFIWLQGGMDGAFPIIVRIENKATIDKFPFIMTNVQMVCEAIGTSKNVVLDTGVYNTTLVNSWIIAGGFQGGIPPTVPSIEVTAGATFNLMMMGSSAIQEVTYNMFLVNGNLKLYMYDQAYVWTHVFDGTGTIDVSYVNSALYQTQAGFTGGTTNLSPVSDHNKDRNLQGGSVTERYHLTLAEHDLTIANLTGTAPPSTTPTVIGARYIDTVNKKYYIAMGTSTMSDWIIMN